MEAMTLLPTSLLPVENGRPLADYSIDRNETWRKRFSSYADQDIARRF